MKGIYKLLLANEIFCEPGERDLFTKMFGCFPLILAGLVENRRSVHRAMQLFSIKFDVREIWVKINGRRECMNYYNSVMVFKDFN